MHYLVPPRDPICPKLVPFRANSNRNDESNLAINVAVWTKVTVPIQFPLPILLVVQIRVPRSSEVMDLIHYKIHAFPQYNQSKR